MGRRLQRTDPPVPNSRLQRVPEEPAAAQQTLRLQRGQHPPAGGRLAVPQRYDGRPLTSAGCGQNLVVTPVFFREVGVHSPTRRRLPVPQRLPGRSGLQSL